MTSIIVNPGAGPVAGTSLGYASLAIEQFVSDLCAEGEIAIAPSIQLKSTQPDGGRYTYTLVFGDTGVEVDMPGLPIEQVRYLGAKDQNIWDFPRLYVDGSSWVWVYAIGAALRAVTGED